jgi:iron(II)-dependent oxidoreductase
VHRIEIEGGNDPGADVRYPWEDSARRAHRHRVHITPLFIGRASVTNAEFEHF